MNSETIAELAAKVKDADRPVPERRAALSLIAKMRGESDTDASSIPADDLTSVVAGMTAWPAGIKGLSMREAAEAVAEGRRRRESGNLRR